MPLGIELAAAWVSVLPCAEIADEIERTIGFLETSMRDVPSVTGAFALPSTTPGAC